VIVGEHLALESQPRVFVIGDQAHFRPADASRALPGVASVAIQQGRHVARVILADMQGQPRPAFRFKDKGQMATIGRRRAVLQRGPFRSSGTFAWCMWLLVHIYFLSGFRNRLFVLLHWCWSYLTFSRGSRLIVEKQWHSYAAHSATVSAAVSTEHTPVSTSTPAVRLDWWEEPTRWLAADTVSRRSA
jgi:NADH dehydrogenase